MTTERKPSERAVECAKELLCALPIDSYTERLRSEIAAIIDKHFPPTLESELVDALKYLKDAAMHAYYKHSTPNEGVAFSRVNDAVEKASSVLTTYHQRKETTK